MRTRETKLVDLFLAALALGQILLFALILVVLRATPYLQAGSVTIGGGRTEPESVEAVSRVTAPAAGQEQLLTEEAR